MVTVRQSPDITSATPHLTRVNALDWMSGVVDTTPLSQMSIPGTHESCALYGGGTTQCQFRSIGQQLELGIRFLDVRCAYADDLPADFYIYHGGIYQKIQFSNVQQQCVEFLTNHPNEVILMNVQQEHSGVDSQTFEITFKAAVAPFGNHWLWPDQIPTLEACRGKIILVRTWLPSEVAGLEWNGFAINGMSYNRFFETQNDWSNWSDTAEKVAQVEQYLKLAADGRAGPNRIYLNFLSRAGAYVGTYAKEMNDIILKYLQTTLTDTSKRLGTLPIDFVSNTGTAGKAGCLEDLIIRRNPFKPGYSFAYSVTPFTLRLSSPGGQTKGWLALNGGGWAISSAAQPLVMERDYQWEGKEYFKTSGGHLSVSTEGQVGQYSNSDDARPFRQIGGQLVSEYNGKACRLRANGELWCGDAGDELIVSFVTP